MAVIGVISVGVDDRQPLHCFRQELDKEMSFMKKEERTKKKQLK